jgi:membrane protein implicated in regulation of membrane protease activity
MPWLFLMLGIAAFALAFVTTSVALAALSLLAALVLLGLWVMGLLAQRVGNQSRDDTLMLDPQELRRLREQAQARQAAAQAEPPAQ